jgi:hypothetical protein
MIYLKVTGRLGNNLFQYAFARRLQIETGEKIEIITTTYNNKDTTWENQLKYFSINHDVSYINTNNCFYLYKKMDIKQIFLYTIFLILRKLILSNQTFEPHCYKFEKFISKLLLPELNKNGLYLHYRCYNENIIQRHSNSIVSGLYQSRKYFKNIEEIIRKEFVPIYPALEKNKYLFDIIDNTESVCIGVRRGDFISNRYKYVHSVCTEKYYLNSINRMKEIHKNAVFIFFSNDINWCKETFKGDDYYFESGNNPVWEKLRLMYSCKHFIISNSSYEWWAQYLSVNKEKTVIVPERWKNIKNFDFPLYENYFIKIPVD